MKIIKIKSKKQDNGHWGMPLACVKLDGIPLTDNDQTNLLQSAIIIALAQQSNEKFGLGFFGDKGFVVTYIYRDTNKWFNIHYNRYFLEDDTLYEFNDEWERTVFLRKKKIEEIEKQ